MKASEQTILIQAIDRVASYFGGKIQKSHSSGWAMMVGYSATSRYTSLENAANSVIGEVSDDLQGLPETNKIYIEYAQRMVELTKVLNSIGRKKANPNTKINQAKAKLFAKYDVDNLNQLRVAIPEAKRLDLRFAHNWDYLVLRY